jgi:hypothetical protein
MKSAQLLATRWVDFDHAAWKAHYGEMLPAVVAA